MFIEMDFKLQISLMREHFGQHRSDKLKLHRPWWMFADEELSKVYAEKETLLEQGSVYYACLLQANNNLFRKFPPFDYPAQIIYSTDSQADENPLILKGTAEELYSYKYIDMTPPDEWAEIVANIKDERERTVLH